ncbi:MAG: hypothetical protein IJ869_06505 [Clostridiales bacterium]|nr:hypothetical protein [Clostridiales bacterium]
MSHKRLDQKGRFRSKTVAFRLSPEEAKQLDIYVYLSGLTKREYIARRLLHHEVTIVGSSRVYKALRDTIGEVLTELKRIESGENVDDELQELIRFMTEVMGEMKDG